MWWLGALESTRIELTDGEKFHDISWLFMAIQPSPTNYPRKKGSLNTSVKLAKGNAWSNWTGTVAPVHKIITIDPRKKPKPKPVEIQQQFMC